MRNEPTYALTVLGRISKSMKGLVGGAAQGSADCRRNWTTALIPRSSGIGTHPTSKECAEAARTAWGGGRYKLARSAMRDGAKQASLRWPTSHCRQCVLLVLLENCKNTWTPVSPSHKLVRGGASTGALTSSRSRGARLTYRKNAASYSIHS